MLDKFKRLIDLSKGLSTYSFVNIVAPVRSNMSDEKIGPMTKNALETIAAKLNDMITRLEIEPPRSNPNCDPLHGAHRKTNKELAQCMSDVVSLLTADALSYKVINDKITSQLPVSSREQFTTKDSEFVTDSIHGSILACVDETTATLAKASVVTHKSVESYMFDLDPEDEVPSKKSSKKKPIKKKGKSDSLAKSPIKSDSQASEKVEIKKLVSKPTPVKFDVASKKVARTKDVAKVTPKKKQSKSTPNVSVEKAPKNATQKEFDGNEVI